MSRTIASRPRGLLLVADVFVIVALVLSSSLQFGQSNKVMEEELSETFVRRKSERTINKREVIVVEEEQWRNNTTFLNDFLRQFDEKSIKTLHKLMNEKKMNNSKSFKRILYNDHIFSYQDLADTLIETNMTETTSQMNFEMKFVVAYNETTIMLTRKISRFYYWEVRNRVNRWRNLLWFECSG